MQTITEATKELADIYRATGSGPDGNEDWRLATSALSAVKCVMQTHDDECERYEARIEQLEAERGSLQEDYSELEAERNAINIKLSTALAEVARLREGLVGAFDEGWRTGYNIGVGDGHPLALRRGTTEEDIKDDWEFSDAIKLLKEHSDD